MSRLLALLIIVLAIGSGVAVYLGPDRLGQMIGIEIAGGQRSAPNKAARPKITPAVRTQEPLFDNLGSLSWPITTSQPYAQLYFDQGLRWAYAFNHSAARRAFQEAQRQDPACAMCFWGEAYVLGPNINAPMDAQAVAPALAAIRKAMELSDDASPKERAIIEATLLRYSDRPKADQASLNKSFAAAIAKAHAAYPEDEHLAVIYVEAVMTTTPWDYWEAGGETPKPAIGPAILTIEQVLAKNPDHAGAIHFYIHLTEASNRPEAAVPYAERLVDLMPGAGHMVHMATHTFYRIGRFGESVEINKKAVLADDLYFQRVNDVSSLWRQGYHIHNIHFVVVSAFMTGDRATALEYSGRLQNAVSDNVAQNVGWIQLIKQAPYFVHAHLSAPQTILGLEDPGDGFPFVRAMWHYARGIAFARTNRLGEAGEELKAIAAVEARKDITYPEDIAPVVEGVLQIAQRVVEGRISEAQEDLEGAIRAYRLAVEIEDKLPYLEPPYWYYPVRQSLGAALMRAKQPDVAYEVFQSALDRVPNNGWALYGLMQAQRALGETADLAKTEQRFKEAWAGDPTALDLSRL